jgi:hypothetical protein
VDVRRDDEHLTRSWLSCELKRSISHDEHLRISFVLLRRHGRDEGARLIAEGTRRNCEALDAADRYDTQLTERWTTGLADALDASDAATADEFLHDHPRFRRSTLYGLPAWRQGN